MSTNKRLLIVSILCVLVACGDDDEGGESRDSTASRGRGGELGADDQRHPDAREEREWIEEMGEDDESEDIAGDGDDSDDFIDEEEIIEVAPSALPPSQPPTKPATPGLPGVIVGSWFAGAGNTTQPYDPTTQSYGTPSGSGMLFTFRADGTYSKAFRNQVSNGGCSTGFSAYEAGVAQVEGDKLSIIPMTGTLSYRDSCVPSLNSDRTNAALESETFTFSRSGDALRLVRDDGAGSVFHAVVNAQ